MRVLTGDNVLIAGFIVTGTEPKKVIIRGIGPSLSTAGLQGVLTNPFLKLYEGNTILESNDNWRDDQEAEIRASTIPPGTILESAIVATLRRVHTPQSCAARAAALESGSSKFMIWRKRPLAAGEYQYAWVRGRRRQ